MRRDAISEVIGRRFHRPPVTSLSACNGLREPIVFSHIVSEQAMPAPTLAPPVEDAFAVHVHHAPLVGADVWIAGRHQTLDPVPDGGVVIFDLRTEPTAQIHESFEFSRFEIARSAMDELAYEHGLRHLGDFRVDTIAADPVVKHLSLALIHRIAMFGPEQDSLFRDALGHAFFAHVAHKYGGAAATAGKVGMLAPWQLGRVTEWVDAHLHQSIAVADLAGLLDLSPSYFARAFLNSLGTPPHQWLLQRRIERAMDMLRGSSLSLAEIAAACGFVDQSHFTKVFTRLVQETPGRWRRDPGRRIVRRA